MKIQYFLEIDDYIAYYVLFNERNGYIKRTVRFQRVFGVAFSLAIALNVISLKILSPFIIAAIFLTIIMIFFTPDKVRRKLVRNAKSFVAASSEGEFYGERTLFLSDDYIRVESNGRVSETSYNLIKELIEDSKRFFIITGTSSAFVVPLTAFVNDAQKLEFLQLIHKRMGGKPVDTNDSKAHLKDNNRKKNLFKRIILISIACIIGAYLYLFNGRTIIESPRKVTEAELEIVDEILDFEEKQLAECRRLLSRYDNRAKELGIKIRPILDRTHAVNNFGRVEKYDLQNELKLPKFYSSKIICYVYKDGQKLMRQNSYFVMIFWLVNTGKNDAAEFNKNPFDNSYTDFDSSIVSLLKEVSDYINYQ